MTIDPRAGTIKINKRRLDNSSDEHPQREDLALALCRTTAGKPISPTIIPGLQRGRSPIKIGYSGR